MLVVVVTWRECVGGELRTEAYGPWTVQAGGSHLAEICTFLRDQFPGDLIAGTTLYAVTPPDEAS